MNNRRQFLKSSIIAGVALAEMSSCGGVISSLGKRTPGYSIKTDIPTRLYNGEQCWIHSRVGIVPGAGINGVPRTVMTMNTHEVTSSDIFKQMFGLHSNDLGKTWTEPYPLENLKPHWVMIDGERSPEVTSDFWPQYHVSSGKLLGIGHTVVYTPDWKLRAVRPRDTTYAIFNPSSNTWSDWKKLKMPQGDKFRNAGAGSVQRFDLHNGYILLPIYFSPPNSSSQVTVLRCHFNGEELTYLEHGTEFQIDDDTRGLHEPSLASFDGRYYLTIRNDRTSFVTRSVDGLNYEPLRNWIFDDGSDLGTHNTQQHWVTHHGGLFLVYTRKGANNDHVARNRAPLFIAQVDPKKLHVIRESERILIPNKGAALGNFGVCDVSPEETWVTVGENMYSPKVQEYGSDGSVWVARIQWDRPNELFSS